MEGPNPQSNAEKNLALERDETFDARAKETDSEKKSELMKHINTIGEYKDLAKPRPELQESKFNSNTADPEVLKQEKEKVEQEIATITKAIESTSIKLNELREKLGMPPSEDIPSLMVKREKLESLREVQKDLEAKLEFVNKKQEAEKEEGNNEKKIEGKSLTEESLLISLGLRKISALINSSRSKQDTEFSVLALKSPEKPTTEELKEYILKLETKINELGPDWSTDENPQLLMDLGKAFSELSMNLKNSISKIKDEEERTDFSKSIAHIVDKAEKEAVFFVNKGQALAQYQGVKI